MQVQWIPSILGSAVHAMAMQRRGHVLVHPAIDDALRGLGLPWDTASSMAVERVRWMSILDAALAGGTIDQAAEALGCEQPATNPMLSNETLHQFFTEIDAAMRQAAPQIEQEMPLRIRPLAEQWEARAPGLCRRIESHLGVPFPGTAKVYLVYPIVGGFGDVHPALAAVRLEAMLVNPTSELPEVVRLAWLLTCLELQAAHPTLSGTTVRLIAMLATLASATEVELIAALEPGLRSALTTWHLESWCGETHSPQDFASLLVAWWNDWQDRPLNLARTAASLRQHLET